MEPVHITVSESITVRFVKRTVIVTTSAMPHREEHIALTYDPCELERHQIVNDIMKTYRKAVRDAVVRVHPDLNKP